MKKLNNLKNNNVGAGPVSARQENKGITLIALIITIIVMLILVAVSISIALNTGLFDSAGKATQDWKAEQEQEQQIAGGQVTVDNKIYNSIEDYVKETQNTITFYVLRWDEENNYETEETLCFKVEKGTTWEDFLAENPIYETQELWIWDLDSMESAMGAYVYGASGPAYELPGNYTSGPWIFPKDPIKNGVTYNWCLY